MLIFSHVKKNRNYDYNAMASLHIRLAKKCDADDILLLTRIWIYGY